MKLSYEELEAKCNALAAENAGLKGALNKIAFTYSLSPHIHEMTTIATPDTDAFLAEVRASAIEYYANLFKDTVNMDVKHNQEFHKGTLYVADQLRKGAAL